MDATTIIIISSVLGLIKMIAEIQE